MASSVVVAGAGVVFLATLASAGNSLGDGDYTLLLPGVGEFEFIIDSDGVNATSETVIAFAAPEGYTVDDDDPARAAWKNVASLEVEIHTDKIEGDYDWAGGDAKLSLPDGGSITVTAPDGAGYFTVTASDGWWAFGSGSDWFVANTDDIATATDLEGSLFFRVEATADGIEIKAVDGPDDGFLNDLEGEEDDDDDAQDAQGVHRVTPQRRGTRQGGGRAGGEARRRRTAATAERPPGDEHLAAS